MLANGNKNIMAFLESSLYSSPRVQKLTRFTIPPLKRFFSVVSDASSSNFSFSGINNEASSKYSSLKGLDIHRSPIPGSEKCFSNEDFNPSSPARVNYKSKRPRKGEPRGRKAPILSGGMLARGWARAGGKADPSNGRNPLTLLSGVGGRRQGRSFQRTQPLFHRRFY
uniref:Uncharacterized protein n=1 Tax=Timema poppense TaxID=170557 RepID=A0A7R9CXA6_TIMPO|nr:unnamed protein product [Timema poppensis]